MKKVAGSPSFSSTGAAYSKLSRYPSSNVIASSRFRCPPSSSLSTRLASDTTLKCRLKNRQYSSNSPTPTASPSGWPVSRTRWNVTITALFLSRSASRCDSKIVRPSRRLIQPFIDPWYGGHRRDNAAHRLGDLVEAGLEARIVAGDGVRAREGGGGRAGG